MWNELTMKQRADVISMAVKAGMRDIDSIRSFYNKTIESGRNKFAEGGPLVTDNVPDDYTYYGGSLPAVTVSAPALPAYQDQFTGQWYGIGPGGRKVNKSANFDPSGARVYTSPEAFERARLNRAYADDLNHFGEFKDIVRKGATALTLAPMTGPLLEGATAAGDAIYTGYRALPWMTQQLIGKGSTALFGAQGLSNFFGPEGIRKTTRLLNEGRYGEAALSAAGDVLDVSMAAPVVTALGNTKAAVQSLADDAKSLGKNFRWLTKQFDGRHSDRRFQELIRTNFEIANANKTDIRIPSIRRAIEKLEKVGDRSLRYETAAIKAKSYYSPPNDNSRLPKYLRNFPSNSGKVDYRGMTEEQKAGYIGAIKKQNPFVGELDPKYIDSATNEYIFPLSKSPFDPKRDIVSTGNITMRDARTGAYHDFRLNPEELNTGEQTLYSFSPETEAVTIRASSMGSAIYPRAPKDYINALDNNIQFVTREAVPGSKVFGSSVSVTSGNLFHATDDIDLIMTESQARHHPKFNEWKLESNGQTYTYNHPTAGKLDVNILREDKNGLAVGPRAHELYFQLHPKEYLEFMKKAVKSGKLPDTGLVLDKTSQELLDSYDPLTKTMADAFFSSKPKHQGRALYFLHYGDVDDTRRAFEMYANSFMGGEYKPSNIPLSEFSNPEANKALLEEMGDLGPINIGQFINDPKRMKLLFDYLCFDKTFVGRGVHVGSSKDLISSLTQWDTSGQGGTAMGVGLNSVLGGNSGHGPIYATITPKRMKPLTGSTIQKVLSEMTHNLGHFDLTSSQKSIIQDIARRNSITIPNNFSSLSDILKSTEGQSGDNYQKMLEELAEAFDIPIITNGWYGQSPYASILENGNFEADIKSLIPYGIDRPVGHPSRASSQSMDMEFSNADFLTSALKHYPKERQISIENQRSKEMRPFNQSGTLSYYKHLEERRKQAYEQAKMNWVREVEQAQENAKNRGAKLREMYANRVKLLSNIKKSLKAVGITTGFVGAGFGIKSVEKHAKQRREERKQEREQRKIYDFTKYTK